MGCKPHAWALTAARQGHPVVDGAKSQCAQLATLQCNAMQCNAMQCNAMQCSNDTINKTNTEQHRATIHGLRKVVWSAASRCLSATTPPSICPSEAGQHARVQTHEHVAICCPVGAITARSTLDSGRPCSKAVSLLRIHVVTQCNAHVVLVT